MKNEIIKLMIIAAISIPAFYIAMGNNQELELEIGTQKYRNDLLRQHIEKLQLDSDETHWNWEVDRKALHIKDSLLKLK